MIYLKLGVHVCFGHVIQGFEIVEMIENLPTDEKNRPNTTVAISHCGELIIKIKSKLILEKLNLNLLIIKNF